MEQPSVIIPLSEYEELKRIKNEALSAIDKGNTITFYSRQFTGPLGYPLYTFNVLNPSETIRQLVTELVAANEELSKQYKKSFEQQCNPKKRGWFR